MNVTHTAARDQSAALLPTYSADTFGVCSTLFELGGMVVIHDPSGCNSTYTTHDEPRWYDHDSLIFISAMTEYDAILGRDDKLIRDVKDAADTFHPNFICIIPSQIATLIATDLPAICRIIERDTHLPTFTLPTNSMQSYDLGIEYALAHLAEHVAKTCTPPAETSNSRARVNLLGLTPLDYHWQNALPSFKTFLTTHGFDFAASWTLDSTLEDIENSMNADVNLVLTKSALPAANILKERLHIPYIAAVPYPPLGDEISQALREAMKRPSKEKHEPLHHHEPAKNGPVFGLSGRFPWKYLNPQDLLFPREMPRQPAITSPSSRAPKQNYIIGEPLSSIYLAHSLQHETGATFDILMPPFTELDLTSTLASSNLILADPLYEALAPTTAHFISIPHRACSGRTYEKQERNLLDPAEWATLLKELKPYL